MRTALISVFVALFVAACGGGGSSYFPLEAAMVTVASTTNSHSASALDGQDLLVLTVASSPAPDAVFDGVVRKTRSVTMTIKRNGAVLSVENYNAYYSLNPFKSYGAIYSDGAYAVATGQIGLYPPTAQVGDSGPIGTLTTYTSDQKLTLDSTIISNWTLEPDVFNSTARGCTNSAHYDPFGVLQFTESECFRLDARGNILGMSYTLFVDGRVLIFLPPL